MHTLVIIGCFIALAPFYELFKGGDIFKFDHLFNKYERGLPNYQNDSLKNKFAPDTSIGPISLDNRKNVTEYLGENVMERLNDTAMMPHSSVLSKDSKQRFTLYFHPGNSKNKFSEFKVNYVRKTKNNEKVTNTEVFKTENGVKLGITKSELKSLKGKPDSVYTNSALTYHYIIDDFENSKFLKKYYMPNYYADYKFKNGYLIEFRFGFEYP